MTKFVDEIWILKVNRSLLFRCLGIVASSVLMWPSPLFLFANVSGMLQVMSWSSGLHGQHPMWKSEWLNLTWCSISIETYWNQVCCPLFCLMFSIWSYLGCLIPVWYISKSCIGACALMQKQGTPRICWISPVGSSVIWVCFNKKLRWELATHLWEELQVHPGHLLSCDRSCDLMCPKKGSVFQRPWSNFHELCCGGGVSWMVPAFEQVKQPVKSRRSAGETHQSKGFRTWGSTALAASAGVTGLDLEGVSLS